MLEKLDVQKKWIKKIRVKRSKSKKNYLHLDYKIDDYKSFLPLISDQNSISHHAFLPFLKFDKPKYKYKEINGKRILVKKEDGKLKVREIMYAGHLDSLIYVWYQVLLDDLYEAVLKKEALSSAVLAYRKIADGDGSGMCNINFANEVFNYIRDRGSNTVVLAFDIENFFPSISHRLLKEKWLELLNCDVLPSDHYNVYKSLTKYSYIDLNKDVRKIFNINSKGQRAHAYKNGLLGLKRFSGEYFRAFKEQIRNLEKETGKSLFIKNAFDRGIPQGSPLSGLLANISLLDFDRKINKLLDRFGGIYRRYSDDVLVVCSLDSAKYVETYLNSELSRVKDRAEIPYLSFKASKTYRILFNAENGRLQPYELDSNHVVTSNRKHLQYLGFEFDGEYVFLRSGSVAGFYNRLQSSIKRLRRNYKKPPLLKRKLFRMHTPLGKRNFFTYLKKARKTMAKNQFKKQLRKFWPIIQKNIDLMTHRIEDHK